MRMYTYTVQGEAAGGQTWSVSGAQVLQNQGQFITLVLSIMRESFNELTMGRAVFGKPGVACKGPYTITALKVESTTDGN